MEWQRFKTTRMYLHPPKSERLITLWREGRIMLGEIETPITKPYEELTAAGIWFVDSLGGAADFKTASFVIRKDAAPVHSLIFTLGDIECTLECACPFERKSTLYGKLTLQGVGGKAVDDKIGFLLRTGLEEKLCFGSPDVYAFYEPDIKDWYEAESNWQYNGDFTCGDYFLTISASKVDFDTKKGMALIPVTLEKEEEKVLYFAFGKGGIKEPDFDTAKADTLTAWALELGKITKLPSTLENDAESLKMIRNLTTQLLQCFCYGVDENDLYIRQGGLQRRVWTYEAMPVLEGLKRIGEFDDYIEAAIDVYFNKYYEESGEIVPLGLHWAMATATVLYSFSRHATLKGKDFFLKYRDKAMHCFEWIRKTRNEKQYSGAVAQADANKLNENYLCVDGLFPPMSCCDHPLVFQAWLTTDGNNLLGLEAFRDACRYFGDKRADEVEAEYTAYRAVMQSALDRLTEEAKDSDEMKVPYTPLGDTPEVTRRYTFAPSMGFMLDALKPDQKVYEKIINYYTRRGRMRGGLYNRMPEMDPSIAGVLKSTTPASERKFVWYVCGQEYGWFRCMLKNGDRQRCKEIIDDSIRYAMSDEYYMLERYHQKNVWYAPWSPNASTNGRMLNMLLDLC